MQFIRAPKQACLVLHIMPSKALPKSAGVASHATDGNRREQNTTDRCCPFRVVATKQVVPGSSETYLTPASLHGRFTRFRQARRNTLSTVSLASAPKGSSSGSLAGCAIVLPSACRVSSLLLNLMMDKNMALAIIGVFGVVCKVCSTAGDVRGEDTTILLGVDLSLSPRTHYDVPSHCALAFRNHDFACRSQQGLLTCQDET